MDNLLYSTMPTRLKNTLAQQNHIHYSINHGIIISKFNPITPAIITPAINYR